MSASASENSKEGSFTTWTFDEPCKDVVSWNSPSSLGSSSSRKGNTNDGGGGVVVKLCEAGDINVNDNDSNNKDLIFIGLHHFDPSSSLESEESKYTENLINGVVDKSYLDGRTLMNWMDENYNTLHNGKDVGSMTPTLRVPQKDNPNKIKRYVILSLGPSLLFDYGHTIGKAIAKRCNEETKAAGKNIKNALFILPRGDAVGQHDTIKDLTTSFYTSIYQDNRFRGTLDSINKIDTPTNGLESLFIHRPSSESGDTIITNAINEGKHIADGVYIAKDIVNTPHNVLNSLSLSCLAKEIANDSLNGCITCKILDKDECERRGMGAYLGVARASETPPQFIHLTYTPPGSDSGNNKVIGVVGKGLLFDTGGYNIKTAGMELMKFDCGGAGAVLGAAKSIGSIQPAGVVCHFVIAACENMINDKGMVPSDILQASNGITIEVVNTDAEGRLTLADSLVYCDQELKCQKIIELSTLTGSCMVALGKDVCGVFTNNDELAKEIDDISKSTNEQSWRMPLIESYNDQLKSSIADITNYGSRYGGSITAGLFLQHFIKDLSSTQFAHIDIAGPCWDDTMKNGGATGFGSKLVTEWIRRQGSS